MFTDEASEYTGASTESRKQTRSRAVRHDKSSTLVPAQDRDAIRCQRPGESRSDIGRPIAFPRSTRNSEVTEPKASDLEGDCWMQKKIRKMLRRHLDATSPRIPMPRHRETDCSQKKMMT